MLAATYMMAVVITTMAARKCIGAPVTRAITAIGPISAGVMTMAVLRYLACLMMCGRCMVAVGG